MRFDQRPYDLTPEEISDVFSTEQLVEVRRFCHGERWLRKLPLLAVGLLVATTAVMFVYSLWSNRYLPMSTRANAASASVGEPLTSQPNHALPVKYEGWRSYISSRETGLSFSYPADWRLETARETTSGESVRVISPLGTTVVFNSDVSGTDGKCLPSSPTWKYFYSAKTMAPGYAVVGLNRDDIHLHYGVVRAGDIQLAGTDSGSCLSFLFFPSQTGSGRHLRLHTDGQIARTDLETAKAILLSFNYQ